jgi:hypothetical protein
LLDLFFGEVVSERLIGVFGALVALNNFYRVIGFTLELSNETLKP